MSHPEPPAASTPNGVPRPSPAVISAVRASCLAVANRPVLLAEVFYDHLFEMAPQTRAMFPADLTVQMQRMTDTLLGAIARLDEEDLGPLEAALRRLGAAHGTRYGVEPEHYLYIGHALTRAVRDVAGITYSGSLSSAWIGLYQWVAAAMIAGAEEAAAPAPAAPSAAPSPAPSPAAPAAPQQGQPAAVALPRPRRPREIGPERTHTRG